MGKHTLQVLQWQQPYKNAIHCLNPTNSPNILRHLLHLNSPHWQNIC